MTERSASAGEILRSLLFYAVFYGVSVFIVLACVFTLLLNSRETFRRTVDSWSLFHRWCLRQILRITVRVEGGASNNLIGGPAAGNVISGNAGAGVTLSPQRRRCRSRTGRKVRWRPAGRRSGPCTNARCSNRPCGVARLSGLLTTDHEEIP